MLRSRISLGVSEWSDSTVNAIPLCGSVHWVMTVRDLRFVRDMVLSPFECEWLAAEYSEQHRPPMRVITHTAHQMTALVCTVSVAYFVVHRLPDCRRYAPEHLDHEGCVNRHIFRVG